MYNILLGAYTPGQTNVILLAFALTIGAEYDLTSQPCFIRSGFNMSSLVSALQSIVRDDGSTDITKRRGE
jgi:hypothetical protein